jgi:hypothetical protein
MRSLKEPCDEYPNRHCQDVAEMTTVGENIVFVRKETTSRKAVMRCCVIVVALKITYLVCVGDFKKLVLRLGTGLKQVGAAGFVVPSDDSVVGNGCVHDDAKRKTVKDCDALLYYPFLFVCSKL